MIKSIIFVAAYLLLIPAILAQDSSSDGTSTDQSPDFLSNQTGNNTVNECKTKPRITTYTSSSPHRVKVNNLLTNKGIDFTIVGVTNPKTHPNLMPKKGGNRTVPRILIKDKQEEQYIGGYDDPRRDIDRMNSNIIGKLLVQQQQALKQLKPDTPQMP